MSARPDAIGILYDRHVARLVAALAHLGGDREVAFDIAQETFARALEQGHRVKLPPEGSAWPWLWTVGRNLLRDRQHRDLVDASARQRLGMGSVGFDANAIDELIARVDAEELHALLAAALDELPAEQREAVVGRVAAGLDYSRLAGGLGVSEEAPRARVSRGLRALRFRDLNPIVELRSELRSAASRRAAVTRRRRRLIVLAVVAVAGVGTSLSIAANGWLTGEPAPPPAVSDFKAYTPQLGFHPQPGKAVLVAQDGVIKLYATTNRDGTYCLVVAEPWKSPSAGDGGTCVQKREASSPITAGLIGGSPGAWVVAGRVVDARARRISFTRPDGTTIELPIARVASTSRP